MAETLSYRRNSSILLEFQALTDESLEIPLDSSPSATIKYVKSGGRNTLQSVILEPSAPNLYTAEFTVPSTWLYGDYIITYKYISEGLEYERDVPFVLSNVQDLEEDQAFFSKQLLDNIWADEYIPSYHQQVASTVEVSGHEIRITLTGNPSYNYDYTVILDGVKSVSGKEITKQIVSTYQAEYKPLFSTPNDVRSVLKGLYPFFEIKEVYVALRDAGQKALQMLRQNTDPNNSRYREYSERNENFFALTKFVVYEASYNLLLDLYNKFLAAKGIPGVSDGSEEENPLIQMLGKGFSLGDFSVSDMDGGKLDPEEEAAVTDDFVKKLRYILTYINQELKFWRDAMMSRNARGYTNPTTATYKSDVASPESRDI